MITPEQMAKSGSEHSEQSALFLWAHNSLNEYPELKWMFAIPNGFYGVQQKNKMKIEGLRNGVPDICLPIRRDIWPALWIELKQLKHKPVRVGSKGGMSDEQIEWQKHLRSQGHGAIVCYGWLEARDVILRYLNG